MQICLSRACNSSCPNRSPQVKISKRQLVIWYTWARHLEYSYLDSKEIYKGFLLVTLNQALTTSPFSTKAEQLVAFMFNPGDFTFLIEPPNPFWSFSILLKRLLLYEFRINYEFHTYRNILVLILRKQLKMQWYRNTNNQYTLSIWQ